MSTHPIERYLARYPQLPALAYGTTLLTLLAIFAFALADVARQHNELNTAAELLSRIEKRSLGRATNPTVATPPPGVPFLDGSTPTVASAALLQRVTSTISSVGGTVVSTEVGPQNAHSKDGYLKVIVMCNLEQNALQRLLHEIESGMPFLFVDQLSTQIDPEANKDGQLRVSLGLTGLWRPTR